MDRCWGIIRNDEPTIIYILFKSIIPDTRIGASNLKYDIEKSTLAKIDNNVKDLLDVMSSNDSNIIDKIECHDDYVILIFIDLLSVPNSTFNSIIEKNEDNWDT